MVSEQEQQPEMPLLELHAWVGEAGNLRSRSEYMWSVAAMAEDNIHSNRPTVASEAGNSVAV